MNDEFKTGEFSIEKANSEMPQKVSQELDNIGEKEGSFPNDEFVIGEGFNLPTEPQPEPLPNKKQRRKHKGVVRSFVWILLILAASIGLALGVIFCMIDYMGLGESKTITVTIEEGEELDSIVDELHKSGAVKIPFVFKMYCSMKKYDEEFKVGAHTLKTDMGYSRIVYELSYSEGWNTETVTVTIPQLASVDDIAALLEEKGVCTKEQFYDVEENSSFNYSFLKGIPEKTVHYRLEGYLFPDTYDFYVWGSKEGAEFAIDKMLSNFDEKFNKDYREKAEKLGMSIHEVTTMASIIELECSGYYDEMPKVSAVFYNRLNNWGDQPKMLGSSPTAEYPYGSGNYDTNKIEGLPPGPMCTLSEEAIKAALYPEKSFDSIYYYFVTDTDFKFYYTRNLDEHNNIIASLRNQGIWGED